MMLSSSSPDQVGRISLTSSLRAIGPSMPSTNSASPSHQNIAVQRCSLAATSDRKARNEPEAVSRWTEKARACGQVTFRLHGLARPAEISAERQQCQGSPLRKADLAPAGRSTDHRPPRSALGETTGSRAAHTSNNALRACAGVAAPSPHVNKVFGRPLRALRSTLELPIAASRSFAALSPAACSHMFRSSAAAAPIRERDMPRL